MTDREHIVQLNRTDTIRLSEFAARPNGALRLGARLTVEAVENGGLLVRTQPFRSTTTTKGETNGTTAQ